MSDGKVMLVLLTVGLIKKMLLCKVDYLPEPYSHNKNKRKIKLKLPNYATKSDLKSATGV